MSWLLWLTVVGALSGSPVLAQNRPAGAAADASVPVAAMNGWAISGTWTYRSYHNRSEIIGEDATRALAQIFGEGVFTFETVSSSDLGGTFDMGAGLILDLEGTIEPPANDEPLKFVIVGTGRDNTPTAGWQYDYKGFLAHKWPNGTNQIPSLVGTVIRAKPHGNAQAGYVASFIAVKQP
jgi:hypothetical protein